MYEYEYLKNGNNIIVMSSEELTDELVEAYVNVMKEKYPGQTLEKIELTFSGDNVAVQTTIAPEKFEKIRRITGYLVGTLDRFNDGKRAEEHDRVKHGIEK